MPPAVPDIAATRARLREQMPVVAKWAYFDHAAVGPLSGPASERVSSWAAEAAAEGDTPWLSWDRGITQTRQAGAQMMGAGDDEVALVPSTTAGICLVAEGLDWRAGDNVVILADEFPSNVFPWKQQQSRGVEVRTVATQMGRLDLAELRAACDARTRVVSLSWVGYATGYRLPLADITEVVHSAGALFFLDAIQGLGVYPLDLASTPIDFLAADGHKWMLGPEGAGYAFIRREHLDRLRPLGVGWHSVVPTADYSQSEMRLKPAAERYEGGSANMPGHLALGASIQMLTAQPTANLEAAILEITDYLCDRLPEAGARVVSHRAIEPTGHDPRSGIVSAELPDRDPALVRKRLMAAGIVTSVRSGRLRLAAHAYNNHDDVDHLIEELKQR